MEQKFNFQKQKLNCRNCGKPLAQVATINGEKVIRVYINDKGKRNHVIIRCKHALGGIVTIECEQCQEQITPYQDITLIAGENGRVLNSRVPIKVIINPKKKLTKESPKV